MSRSPEGKRRLIETLSRSLDSFSISRQFVGRVERQRPNWPSETTRNTNAAQDTSKGFFVTTGPNPPAARHSPARLKEAVSWWFARAEARRIIERMMQP